ncbi:MAG: histidine kinase, partial [Bacilli bacterium]|nr:histidine kinase [Bacilli bacterium]
LEVDQLLAEKGIEIAQESDPKKVEQSLARLFPIEGGILATMVKDNPDYEYIAVSGMENCLTTLKDVIDGKVHHAFIEMSACAGSCINGPAIRPEARSFASAIIDVKRSAGKKDFNVQDYAENALAKAFHNQSFYRAEPSEEEIINVLRKIGKTSKKDELNCASCGYSTCREKAIAVIQGKASLEMCLPYLMEKERSFASSVVEGSKNGLAVVNETFLFTLVNPALSRMMGKSQTELLSSAVFEYFDLGIFADAFGGVNVPPTRLQMAGTEKVFEISLSFQQRYHIVIAVFRDVTLEEKNKRLKAERIKKTAEITSEVISKNMRAVQEIAQLLGEATAETKIALTNLEKTLQEGDGDE